MCYLPFVRLRPNPPISIRDRGKKLLLNETAQAAIVLIAILQICFFPFFWAGKTLLSAAEDAPSIVHDGAAVGSPTDLPLPRLADPGAAAWQTEPWFALSRDEYRAGIPPLWNPYQGYGTPLAANMQSQPFYPLTAALLFHLTPRFYNYYILLRLFIAGIFTYLFLRLFLSFTASISGGIFSMLTGYFIVFLTVPNLSVEILLPAILLAGEYLLRRKKAKQVFWLAISVMVTCLGGMPESTFLLLAFASVYLLFRILSFTEFRQAWKRLIVLLAISAGVGLCLAAFLLFPFIQYMLASSNSHFYPFLTGSVHDKFDLSVLTYFFPLLSAPIYAQHLAPPDQFRNYIGLLSVFLIIISVGSLFERRRDNQLKSLTCFFSALLLFFVLKMYGFVAVNWVGRLPIFNLVLMDKYDEPILGFCAWVLCSIAVERLMRNEASRLLRVSGLVVPALIWGAAFLMWKKKIRAHIDPAIIPAMHFALLLPAILLAILCAVIITSIWFHNWKHLQWIRGRRLGVIIIALITTELSLNYIFPTYRFYERSPSIHRDPYQGAAFVRFLQDKARGSRIFGRHWMLMPSWAAVFGLADIRNVDALYYRKYFPFLNTFLHSTEHAPTELVTTFYGNGAFDFQSPLQKRLLELSSVKYLLTPDPFVAPNSRIEEILRQNRGHLTPGKESLVGRVAFKLDGVSREGLGEHPPYERLPYTLVVPANQSSLHFSYGLSSKVFSPDKGDGVGFTLEVREPSGQIAKLFSAYIDPKHNLEQRRWMDGVVDLSRYRGKKITLLFSTDPGPRGDTRFDWAAWSNLRFDSDPVEPLPDFQPVYEDADAEIYEYDHVLPRAAIYYNVITERNEAGVLRKLADTSLDVFQTAVLDASRLSGPEASAVKTLEHGVNGHVDEAQITRYEPSSVQINASLRRSGILVLNDSDYPGWSVSIDGHSGKWFPANYLFRGVLLGPGTHIVSFKYRPISFYYGVALSLFTLVVLAVFAIVGKRTRSSAENTRPKNIL